MCVGIRQRHREPLRREFGEDGDCDGGSSSDPTGQDTVTSSTSRSPRPATWRRALSLKANATVHTLAGWHKARSTEPVTLVASSDASDLVEAIRASTGARVTVLMPPPSLQHWKASRLSV